MKNNLDSFQQFAPKAKHGREITSRCVVYTRVSSRDQGENTSLEYQRKRCEEYATRKGYTIVKYFGGTHESAKNDERTEFKKMISFVRSQKEKVSKIIVLSFDRFSRSGPNSIFLIANLKLQNIFVESATQETDSTTPSGELLQNMQLLFSKLDNDQRRQKTVGGMQEMVRAGYLPNHAPVGYLHVKGADWDNRIILDPVKAPLIKKAYLSKAQEGKTNSEIAEMLSGLGWKINRKRLTEIFSNPFYCGILVHNILPGEVFEGKHPKIVSEELFMQVNNITAKTKLGKRVRKEYLEFPLKQFAKCDHCGTPLTAYRVKKKNVSYYKCNRIGCKVNRNTNVLHDRFIELLKHYKVDPRSLKPIEKMMCRVFNQLNQTNVENNTQMQKQLSNVKTNIDKLTDKYVKDSIPKEVYEQTIARYQQERKKIEENLSNQGNQLSNLDKYVRYSLQLSKSLPEMWQKPDLEMKKKLQNLVFPEGVRFNKEKDDYRTSRANILFAASAYISAKLKEKKSGTSDKMIEDSAVVALRGI